MAERDFATSQATGPKQVFFEGYLLLTPNAGHAFAYGTRDGSALLVFRYLSGLRNAAMMAGLAGHVWSFDELFDVVLKGNQGSKNYKLSLVTLFTLRWPAIRKNRRLDASPRTVVLDDILDYIGPRIHLDFGTGNVLIGIEVLEFPATH